jgi:RNA polymerase sigma factor (sigma-70 family)
MSFPETRLTLIERIAAGGSQADWRRFFDDYWSPVFRFCSRWGRLGLQDAEDVTSQTFETLLHPGLLARWTSERRARLRTFVCSVARNLLANHARRHTSRERLLRDRIAELECSIANLEWVHETDGPGILDAFYESWAEEQLERAMGQLLSEFHRQGKGDYFRILYGRICEELTLPEIAASLHLAPTSVENHFRRARERLATLLKRQVREHVERYAIPAEVSSEIRREWQHLGYFLKSRGGIELALQGARANFDPNVIQRHQHRALKLLIVDAQLVEDEQASKV